MTTESNDRQPKLNEIDEVEGYGTQSAGSGGGAGRPQTIEISSFSWGMSNMGAAAHGSGGGAGKVSFSDLSIM